MTPQAENVTVCDGGFLNVSFNSQWTSGVQ